MYSRVFVGLGTPGSDPTRLEAGPDRVLACICVSVALCEPKKRVSACTFKTILGLNSWVTASICGACCCKRVVADLKFLPVVLDL